MSKSLARSGVFFVFVIATLVAVWSAPLLAQDTSSTAAQMANASSTLVAADGRPNYADWDRTAARAEDVIEADQASDEALETLRAQLVRWREQFLTRQSANSARIETLRSQIDALGAAPEGDATEPEQIANRRAALNEQLAEAQAPVRRAQEAFRQANGLISQIDGLVRDRGADRLLRLDPTPLNPVNWAAGIRAIGDAGEVVSSETERNLASSGQQKNLKDNLPLALVLVLVGLILITRAGAWIERFIQRLRRNRTETRASFRAATFVGSLLALALPVLGVILIIGAVDLTGITGLTGDLLLEEFASAVISIAAARWLSLRVFPSAPDVPALINVSPIQRREGRFYAVTLALLASLNELIVVLATASPALRGSFDLAAQSVLRFPLILIAGILLFRLGQILVGAARGRAATGADEDGASERLYLGEDGPGRVILRTLGQAACLVGAVGPILAGIGYVAAASDLLFATVLTIGLVGIVAVIQRFARDIYAIVMRSEQTSAALFPVLVDFVIVLCALPILALIWGARATDLSEVWSYVANGFQIGESRISPLDFMAFLLVFAIGYGLTRLLQGTLRSSVLPKTRIDIGGQNALVAGTGYIGIFLAAIAAITSAGLDLSSLAIVAGALSVGIGFGLQTIVSNFVSGIILLIERPISEGDWIEVGSTMGVVKDISVRATRVETFDRRDVIVPNADLISTSVTNWTKGNLNGRIILPVGVAYGSDTKQVEAILREITEAHPAVILNPPPAILFMNFGADALEFEIRAILRDVSYSLSARSDINHEIAKRFGDEGIEVPYAQRDIWIRNPEALTGDETESSETDT